MNLIILKFLKEKRLTSTFVVAVAIVVFTAVALFLNGRTLWGVSDGFCLWFGAAVGNLTSQCFLDPYTFTHILHGFLFFFLLWPVARKLPIRTRFLIAMAIEGIWEVVENTNFIIGRFREANIAMNYFGDSILNSIGDILSMAVGFLLAAILPVVLGVVIFLVVEIFLLWWIHDSLLLQILALIYPFEFIKNFQNGVWPIW